MNMSSCEMVELNNASNITFRMYEPGGKKFHL